MISEYKNCKVRYSIPHHGKLPILILTSEELRAKGVKKSYIFKVHSLKDDSDYQVRLFIEELIQLVS